MARFLINEGYSGSRTVDAAHFTTNGEFVDFYDDEDDVVLRYRAARIETIERTTEAGQGS